MEATFVTLACCLLAFSSALTTTSGPTSSQTSKLDVGEILTTVPSSPTPHSTPDTLDATGSTEASMTTTPATQASAGSTTALQTSPATTPTTVAPSPAVTTTGAEVTTSGKLTVSAASPTTDGATEESRLHGSEKYITIVLVVTLGAVVVALSVCALCKHKRRQFAHEHLDDCGDMREFVSDEDTLVISGGLYDAHPIYDNVPPPSNEQREYRLEFYR